MLLLYSAIALIKREKSVTNSPKKIASSVLQSTNSRLAGKKKLSALKFAITAYLKEPNGLTQSKFFIQKGNSDCRFNILNYLSPFWHEITNSGQEFHITFNLNSDEEKHLINDNHYFRKNDEIFFMKREEFWLAKRKGDIYTYKSARLLKEPFKSVNNFGKLINIFGLILDYNEKDSTVTVVDMSKVLKKYHEITGCKFESKDLQRSNFKKLINPLDNLQVVSFKKSEFSEFPEWKSIANNSSLKNSSSMFVSDLNFSKKINKRYDNQNRCNKLLKSLRTSTKKVKNFEPYWTKLWQKVVGIVDYVDPIQAVLRTWDLKFAVLPCQLKWSNNLMMVLPERQDDGKCLKFTAATEGELFVVIATTPSDQNTWYIFQITTKGVIFYKV